MTLDNPDPVNGASGKQDLTAESVAIAKYLAALDEACMQAWRDYRTHGSRYHEGFADGLERADLLAKRNLDA